MMKVLVAFALFAFAAAIQNYNVEDARLFGEFMRTYNKKYESGEEFQKRFQIFANNLKEIERKNRESKGAVFNVTKFADMTKEEFRSYPCGVDKLSELNDKRPGFVPQGPTEPTIVDPNLPTSFDWTTKGAVTPVKDQQQCGSCWAFSVIGNAEGVWFLAGNKLTGLSEEQLVSCSTTDYGCSGGWPFWAWTDMLSSPYSGRIDTESGYPYTSGDGDNGVCQFGTNDVGATFTKYTSYCTEQTAACSETDMQQWLITYGPLSVCLDADPMQFYQGGVDNPTDCDPNAIDHCVTLVGYGVDNGTPFWRLKNSWNTNWGEQGYYRLIRGTGACGINKVITIATAKK
jgi:C1A family cysteine protease